MGEKVCADAPLRLTFNEPPTLGHSGKFEIIRASDGVAVETIDLGAPPQTDQKGVAGSSTLRSEPVTIEGNIAHIRLRAHALSPNESYRVRIASSAFTDMDGNNFRGVTDGWTFHTKAALPRNPARVTVAADGSADFCTVHKARSIRSSRIADPQPAVIFIRKKAATRIRSAFRASDPHIHLGR